MCPIVVIGRFLPGRGRFKSILMTFQKSTCPDGRKKKKKKCIQNRYDILMNQQSAAFSAAKQKAYVGEGDAVLAGSVGLGLTDMAVL